VCNFIFHRIGPNLAKADFSATESQRSKKYSQNQCVMPTDTCTDPVGSRKVRPVHRERSLEHTGRVNRCKSWCIKAKCVVTWERRTSGTHFKPIERSLSVYLAKFWGFARLGPCKAGRLAPGHTAGKARAVTSYPQGPPWWRPWDAAPPARTPCAWQERPRPLGDTRSLRSSPQKTRRYPARNGPRARSPQLHQKRGRARMLWRGLLPQVAILMPMKKPRGGELTL